VVEGTKETDGRERMEEVGDEGTWVWSDHAEPVGELGASSDTRPDFRIEVGLSKPWSDGDWPA
jgi:hypothetical protein